MKLQKNLYFCRYIELIGDYVYKKNYYCPQYEKKICKLDNKKCSIVQYTRILK